jgi:single-strand DNA-binding protein
MLNKAQLIGRVGRDPEIRYTADGNPVASLSLATTEKMKGQESTEWHNVVFFGKLAGVVEQYVKKGTMIYVEGKIQTDKWETKDGSKRTTVKIIAFTLKMLGNSDSSKPKNNGNYKPKTEQFEDDIPF